MKRKATYTIMVILCTLSTLVFSNHDDRANRHKHTTNHKVREGYRYSTKRVADKENPMSSDGRTVVYQYSTHPEHSVHYRYRTLVKVKCSNQFFLSNYSLYNHRPGDSPSNESEWFKEGKKYGIVKEDFNRDERHPGTTNPRTDIDNLDIDGFITGRLGSEEGVATHTSRVYSPYNPIRN